MQLLFLTPRPELSPYIDSFWLFESDFGVPVTDSRIIAPNGRAKIIVPYQNALFAHIDGHMKEYSDQRIWFIGVWSKPTRIESRSRITGTIGIELSPKGVRRFSGASMQELTNTIVSFDELYGKTGYDLQQQVGNCDCPENKIGLLQDFLVQQLNRKDGRSSIVDFSVDQINASSGLIEVRELERRTGYTKRYLDRLFQENLGISPKTFSGIVRFQKFYVAWANSEKVNFFDKDLYDYYYDQAHFIKEFKRFTGHSPGRYARVSNEFGKIFYKQ